MKKFQKIIMKPFSSANANLDVLIEAHAQRKNQTGDMLSNAYLSTANNIYNNIPIYVVFEYKNDNQNGTGRLYISYPNMEDFKETIRFLRKNFNNAFGEIKNALVVKPEFADGILLDGIGQNSNWAQFKYVVCKTVENGIEKQVPAVGLTMSVSEGFMSILTEKEIKHLDYFFQTVNLTQLAWEAGIAFMNSEDSRPTSIGQPRQETFRATTTKPTGKPIGQQKKFLSVEEEDDLPFLPPRTNSKPQTGSFTASSSTKSSSTIVNLKNVEDNEAEIGDLNFDNDSDIDDIFEN